MDGPRRVKFAILLISIGLLLAAFYGETGLNKTASSLLKSRTISRRNETRWRRSDPFFEALTGQLLQSFDTNISNATSVLQLGFPAKWDSCTLRDMYSIATNSSSRQVEIAVLGGSSTAHSATRCNPKGGQFGGRYTDLLQRDLNNDMLHSSITFNVRNLGHGATDTFWNSLMLDELIDPSATDILIWEYATNDALGGSTGYPSRTPEHCRAMLNLWLWRVARLFADVGRSPPPIIMVYLWDANFSEATFEAVSQSAIHAQMEVIEFYRQQGWSIEVLNVGGVVNAEKIARDFFQLLDDAHHPNCIGMNIISAMIRQTLYSDLAACGDDSLLRNKPKKHQFTPMRNKKQSSLLQFLLEGSARVGSIMQWTPQQGTTSLRIYHDANVSASIQATVGSKAASSRNDRKLSYRLPPCPQRLQFSLFEPTLEYIGAGYGGGDDVANKYEGQVEVMVNGILINPASTVTDGFDFDILKFMSAWVHIPTNIPTADQYTVSFCKKATTEAECIFKNATTIEEVCPIWYALKNTTSCPLEYAGAPDVTVACINYFFSPEGREIAKKYGSWVGSWGKGEPQINWLIGVMQSNQ